MSATIRLMRFGKRKQPFYRIVVLDIRKKRDGAYIERLGTYNPLLEGQNIEIVKERFDDWRRKGAQISDGLTKLLVNEKRILYK